MFEPILELVPVIERLSVLEGVVVAAEPGHWTLSIAKNDGLCIEATVPRSVLEWSVCVNDAQGVARFKWWNDFYAAKDATRAELSAWMATEIEHVIRQLADVNLRLRLVDKRSFLRTRRIVEWTRGGEWSPQRYDDFLAI